MNSAQLINQDSGDTEYYTPTEIVDAAREVMGGIDLDPASSKVANERVKATNIFTEKDDGLSQKWLASDIVISEDICETENNLILGQEIETIRLTEICQIKVVRDVEQPTNETWSFSTEKEHQKMGCPRGAENATPNLQEKEHEAIEPQTLVKKSTDRNKPSIVNLPSVLHIRGDVLSWIMLLDERELQMLHLSGTSKCGNTALNTSIVNVLTAGTRKNLLRTITSLYPIPSQREQLLQISFRPVPTVILPREQNCQQIGVQTQLDTPKSKGISIVYPSKVWLNHPFSREGNRLWIKKLDFEYKLKNVKQACCITFAATSEKWFQPLMVYPQCYLAPRTNYFLPDGSKKVGVTKGSVVTYFGENLDAFVAEFKKFGRIKVCVG